MYAYHLCDVRYKLRDMRNEIMQGSGGLWLSPDSILIKSGKWWYLPSSHIKNISVEKDKMKILLQGYLTLEFTTRNDYILNALYHYIEGVKWVRA